MGPETGLAMDRPSGSMDPRPVRVRLVGLLPAVLKPCGPACAQPFMNRPVEKLTNEEMDDTPAYMRENGERAHAFAEQLFRDFGNDVRIEVVGLDSPRGFLLAARHRVGKEFAVVVGRDQVVRDPTEYAPVRDAVSAALRARSAPAT